MLQGNFSLWWEALDCRQMSIATGYARPQYCGHFVNAPKYNGMNGLTSMQEEVVAVAGYALAMGMKADFDGSMMSALRMRSITPCWKATSAWSRAGGTASTATG